MRAVILSKLTGAFEPSASIAKVVRLCPSSSWTAFSSFSSSFILSKLSTSPTVDTSG